MKAADIASALRALGRRQEAGDLSQLVVWVVSGELAVSHRPLRHHPLYGGSVRNLAPSAAPLVVEWARQIADHRIRSVICLMHEKELAFYSALDLGAPTLIEFYRNMGFSVVHIPWEDPAHSKSSAAAIIKSRATVQELALAAFHRLPKPVLLHCSAGIDRSSPVAEYICSSSA